MDRETVKSSYIVSAGYDPVLREMEVEFANGVVGKYRDVPLEVWEGFRQAESKGAYLAREMKGVFFWEAI